MLLTERCSQDTTACHTDCNFLRYRSMTELMCGRGLDNDVTECNEINET